MNFNSHSELEGLHAFLSPSNYHWINYDEEKMVSRFNSYKAAQIGTELHELARMAINLGVKLPRTNKTLNLYVNDAIGFKMKTEQILFYSINCFGTTDAISFKKNLLRIHDLKNGETKASINQLLVYDALFCLEYGYKPTDIEIENRIYQFDQFQSYVPDPEEILYIMNKIVEHDNKIEALKINLE